MPRRPNHGDHAGAADAAQRLIDRIESAIEDYRFTLALLASSVKPPTTEVVSTNGCTTSVVASRSATRTVGESHGDSSTRGTSTGEVP